MTITGMSSLTKDEVVFPKLFRRLVDYKDAGTAADTDTRQPPAAEAPKTSGCGRPDHDAAA